MRVSILDTEVGLYHHRSKGVDWVFVDHPSYPRPGGLYADAFGVYGDNQVMLVISTIWELFLGCVMFTLLRGRFSLL